MDGICNPQNHQNFIDESTRALYVALPTSKKKKTSKNNYDSGEDLGKSVSPVAISSFGKQINGMYEQLEKIQDPEIRRQAAEGMRQLMLIIGGNPDKARVELFSNSMNKLKEQDIDVFNSVFIEAFALVKSGFNLGRWIDIFLGLTDNGNQKSYLHETSAILGFEEESSGRKRSSLNQMFGGVNKILESDVEEKLQVDVLNQFFRRMETQANLDEKNSTIENFFFHDDI